MSRQYMRNMMNRQVINSAKLNEDVGRIELWGEVYEDVPIDWWTGEPVKGNFITYQKFKDAFESVKDCKTVELHLNSYGGDATVGLTMANLIKSSNQHIIGVNDGICASAAMTILSACEEVRTHKSSLFMIHQTMSLCIGFYNNEELSHVMDCNGTYDSAAAEVYAKKTGMSKNQCLNLMKKTTWMDGVEAINKGFADSLVPEEEEVNAPVELINKSTMKINGIEHNLDMFNLTDDFIQRSKKNIETINLGGTKDMGKKQEDLKDKLWNTISSFFISNSAANDGEEDGDEDEKEKEKENKSKNEGDENEDEKEKEKEKENKSKNDEAEITEEELQNRIDAAVKNERARIQAIQSISGNIDKDLVNEAMFGETACDAGELALRALANDNKKKADALDKLNKDSEGSKVNNVKTEPPQNKSIAEQRSEAVKNLKKKKEEALKG